MKTKKTQKKSVGVSRNHITITRSIISLLIVMLAGSLFFLFRTYQENIMMNNMFYPFMILTIIAMALLISLLFLINPVQSKK